MSIVDIILAIIILIGAFSGYKDGFLASLFSLVAIILGLLLGFKLMGFIMVLLAGKYNIDAKALPFIAFGVVFIIVVILVNVIGGLVRASISKPVLGPVDHGAGAILGIARAMFMLSITLWIVDSLKIKFPENWIANSWLHPITANFAPKVANWIGGFLPVFRDVL